MKKRRKKSPMNKCQAEFAALTKAVCAEARYFAWPMEMIQPNNSTGKFLVMKNTILIPFLCHPFLLMLLTHLLTLMLLSSNTFLTIFPPMSKVMQLSLTNILQTQELWITKLLKIIKCAFWSYRSRPWLEGKTMLPSYLFSINGVRDVV